MIERSKIQILARRIKESPDDTFSKFALALELCKIDKNAQAILLFEDIVQNDPNYVGVYYHLGELYASQGENKKALKTYKAGIKIAETLNDSHAKSELSAVLTVLELELEE